MNLIGLVGIILIAAIAATVLKQYKPDFAVVLILAGSIVILLLLLSALSPVLEQIQELANRAGIDLAWVKLLLKALGICFLTQFAADSCRDAGQTSLASKAEMAGRIAILVLSLPMLQKIIEIVFRLVE